MKKFSILFLGFIFLFSCSNDSEVIQGSNSQATDIVKSYAKTRSVAEMYGDYINSTSYISYQGALKSFRGKLNFSGSPLAIDTETKLFNWISINLAQTNFTSYQEAVNDFNDLKMRNIDVINENHDFYLAVNNSANPSGVLHQLILPPAQPEVDITCAATGDHDCENEFASAMTAATNTYISDMVNAIGKACSGDYNGSALGQTDADLTFQVTVEGAQNSFKECLAGRCE